MFVYPEIYIEGVSKCMCTIKGVGNVRHMVVGDMTILMCAYGCSVVVRPFLEFFEVLGLSEDGLVGELVGWGAAVCGCVAQEALLD